MPLGTSDSLSRRSSLLLSVTREEAILNTDVSSNDRDGHMLTHHIPFQHLNACHTPMLRGMT